MENKEDLVNAFDDFNKNKPEAIPDILECFLKDVAKTGETKYPWTKIKSLIIKKTDVAMKNFESIVSMESVGPYPNVENASFEELRHRILSGLQEFSGAPFTIQRIVELIVEPRKHYTRTDKFLRGIEKNVNVVTTVDARGNKILTDPLCMNGEEEDDVTSPDKNTSLFIPPPPVNSPAAMTPLRNNLQYTNGINQVEKTAVSSLFKEEIMNKTVQSIPPTSASSSTSDSEAEAKSKPKEEDTSTNSEASKDDKVPSVQIEKSTVSKTEADSQAVQEQTLEEDTPKEEPKEKEDNEAEQSCDSSKREAVSHCESEPPEKRQKQDESLEASSSQDAPEASTSIVDKETTSDTAKEDTLTTTQHSHVTSSDESENDETKSTTHTTSEEQIATQNSEKVESKTTDSCTTESSETNEASTKTSQAEEQQNVDSCVQNSPPSSASSTSSESSICSSSGTDDIPQITKVADEKNTESNITQSTTVEADKVEDSVTNSKPKMISEMGDNKEASSKNTDTKMESADMVKEKGDIKENESESSVKEESKNAEGGNEQEPMDTD